MVAGGRMVAVLTRQAWLSVLPQHNLNLQKICSRILHRKLHIRAAASASTASASAASHSADEALRDALLERLRLRQLRDASWRKGRGPSGAERVDPNALSIDLLPSTFEGLGLGQELLSAVEEMQLGEPTEVQKLAIPAILDGEDVILASHTGSGKTLAYLLPLVQALRMDEAESSVALRPNRPRAVVLCPTRELAEQVREVAKFLSHHARFRSAVISGGVPKKPQVRALSATVDLVVGTPGRLLLHAENDKFAFGDIKYVVLDEADTLFDEGFGPEVKKFFDPLRNRDAGGSIGFQTVLVTATVTKEIQKLVDDEFPGIKHVFTSTLHKKVDTSRHHFIKVPGNESKMEALLQVLEPALKKRKSVMVFCNTVQSCRAVDHYLNEADVSCVNYHGEVPPEQRADNFEKFNNPDGPCPALVCTDLAARGLDLSVDHVVMFDFPHNSIDYLHRSGRTARMGAKGKVTSLVTKRDRTLAGRLETAMSRGESLDTVTATREKLVASKRFMLKAKQREVALKAASRGLALDKPGTMTLALQRLKAKRYMKDNFPRGGKRNQVRKTSKAKAQTLKARKAARTNG